MKRVFGFIFIIIIIFIICYHHYIYFIRMEMIQYDITLLLGDNELINRIDFTDFT